MEGSLLRLRIARARRAPPESLCQFHRSVAEIDPKNGQ
jgi:hypothetical protein